MVFYAAGFVAGVVDGVAGVAIVDVIAVASVVMCAAVGAGLRISSFRASPHAPGRVWAAVSIVAVGAH